MNQRRAALLLAVLFAAAIPFAWKWGHPLRLLTGSLSLERPLAQAIPSSRDGWVGEDVPLGEDEIRVIQMDDSVRRRYRNADGEMATLFVSFYGNKEKGLQRYYHNPTICYRDAGWALADTRFETVTLGDLAMPVPTCRYTFTREGRRQLVLTVFKVDGELLDESPRNKPVWMLFDRLTPRFDDGPGTFVQIQVIVPVGAGGDESASALATRFLLAFGRDVFLAVEPR